MKKRLFTKLISLVSSIALFGTSIGITTAGAAKTPFSDVDDSSSYTQAFNELYALDILVGYEDGTVLPDNLITRAEVTKLVVAMMGPQYTSQASNKANTDFTDVPYSEWYSGYVNVGVANGFISGNGDGTFSPDANVTYQEIVKMIVAAMGYGPICEKRGGWPNGYLGVASEIGVTTGVSCGNETAVTRGQVAQLIDNAIKLPIVSVTGYTESAYTGQLIAQTQVMDDIDGTDAKDYQTLLTKNHNVYSVKGRIMATKRSDPTGLDADEVRFSVENTKNFEDVAYGTTYADAEDLVMTYKGTDAQDLMFTYADALIKVDDDDDYEILTITPYGSTDTVTLDASLYDTYKSSGGYITSIDMYTSESSSKTKTYKMASYPVVYVNGVGDSSTYFTPDDVANYIENNDNGKITFIDKSDTGKTTSDGKIDIVVITYYDDAIVDSVYTGSSNYKVYFKNNAAAIKQGSLVVDPDDDDITVNYHLGSKDIDYTELEEDDVLSIAYDVTEGFKDSSFYDVYVSRNEITGRVDSKSEDYNGNEIYTINGSDYKVSYSLFPDETDVLSVGTYYNVQLNYFGRIAYVDQDTSSKVIGLVDYAYISSDDTPQIRIITSKGTKTSYTVKNSDKTLYKTLASKFFSSVGTTGAASGKYPIENRVCEYTINSYGYLTQCTPLYSYGSSKSVPQATDAEYKASTNKIGSYAMDSSTIILDLTDNSSLNDLSKISVGTPSGLTDGGTYSAFFYEKSSSDSTYRFVLLTGGSSTYNGNTNIAIYKRSSTVYDSIQGTSVDAIQALSADTNNTVDGEDNLIQIKLDSTCDYYMQTLAHSTYYQNGDSKLSESDYLRLDDVGFYANGSDTVSIAEYEALPEKTQYKNKATGGLISLDDYTVLPTTIEVQQPLTETVTSITGYKNSLSGATITVDAYNALADASSYTGSYGTLTPTEFAALTAYGYYKNAAGTVLTVEEYNALGEGTTSFVSEIDGSEITEEQYEALSTMGYYISSTGKKIEAADYDLLPATSGYKGADGIITEAEYSKLAETTVYVNGSGKTITIEQYSELPKTTGYVNKSKASDVIDADEYAALSATSAYKNTSTGKLISDDDYAKLPATTGYVDKSGNTITESKYNSLPSTSGYVDKNGKSISDAAYEKLNATTTYTLTVLSDPVLGNAAALTLTKAQYEQLPARSCYKDSKGDTISISEYDKLDTEAKKAYTYVMGKDCYSEVLGKDSYSYTVGKDAYTYQEGKDQYVYVLGKDSYEYSEGKDAYTKQAGKDSYTAVEGKDAYTYVPGKENYNIHSVAGQKDEYSYVPGQADYSLVEGKDDYEAITETVENTITINEAPATEYVKDDYELVVGQDSYSYVYGKNDYEKVTTSSTRGDKPVDIDDETVSSLKTGDMFIYDTDSDGYVTEIAVLFNAIQSTYSSFLSTVFASTDYYDFDSDNNLFSELVHPVEDWLETTSSTKTGKVEMIFGPIVDKSNRNVSIGIMQDNGSYVYTDKDTAEDYSLTSSANVYVYDYGTSKVMDRVYKGSSASIVKTNVPSSQLLTNDSGEKSIIDLEDVDVVNFIVAKVVDGDIAEALVILGNN